MSDYFVGQIFLLPYRQDYVPEGMHLCDGSLLPVAQNAMLFSVLGTQYGGDGVQTFGLPDLRGRVPIGAGTGPGLPPYGVGQTGGMPAATLTLANMPQHSHRADVSAVAQARGVTPENPTAGDYLYVAQTVSPSTAPAVVALGGGLTSVAGGSLPLSTMPPYLAMNYFITLNGVYPVRA